MMNLVQFENLKSLVEEGEISKDELDEGELYAIEFDSYDEYCEGYSDGLASQTYEEDAYGWLDDMYHGPEHPIFRERND